MAERESPELPPVELLLRLEPQARWVGERLEVQYLASLRPAGAPAGEAQPAQGRPDPVAPWAHRLAGADVEAAIDALRRAAPEQRYQRALALIARMTGAADG
jgi:hypothetical protein